ncbi:hypothetical protein [Marinigracilibium pacificum]|uniref:Uncharacterized protein n=1 Tax=Marinigracilibium pacificum TaxID=2729599 RepID=A0A848J3V8_9BACT|nr:hypothetical protein [Marinigracilibium pacificum]NMM47862.1 hypothetical protein [Marinigracilibium pacificum]
MRSIVLFLLHLFAIGIYSQNEFNYSGEFNLGNFRGKANFSYILENSDTIYNGGFEFKYSKPDSLIGSGDKFFDFTGTFKDGFPNGFWSFKIGNLQTSQDINLDNYQFRIGVNGILHEANGKLINGKPNGIFTHNVHRLVNSTSKELLFRSKINFDKGIPQKTFSIENDQLTLVGRFLRDGLAHDNWELYSGDVLGATENWIFNNGWLRNISITNNNQTRNVELYSDQIENYKIINLDKRYIEILKLQTLLNGVSDTLMHESSMIEMLSQNASYYKSIDDILFGLGNTSFMPEFKVKVGHYPYTKEELKSLENITYALGASEKITSLLLDNTQLRILELSDSEVQYLVAVAEAIDEHHIKPAKTIIDYYENDVLEYIERNDVWFAAEVDGKIKVSTENGDSMVERIYTGPINDFDFNISGLALVEQISGYSLAVLEDINNELEDKLRERQKEQSLADLEEKMIIEIKSLNSLLDSLILITSGEPSLSLMAMKKDANAKLKDYSELPGVSSKLERGEELITCFTNMNGLAISVSEINNKKEILKEEYTDQVWNPFTSTVMDEDIKKRIMNAYNSVLIPEVLNEVNNDLSCERVSELQGFLDELHSRMIEMKDEDTSKMERKLKRADNANEVLELFNIQPIFKNI